MNKIREEERMTKVKPVPEGYHSIQPYLYIRGAAAAIEFYKQVFGARERMRMPVSDGRLQHAEIEIGDSCLMLADEYPEKQIYSPKHLGGTPVSIMLYVDDCDATYQKALAAGAKSLREPQNQFYGDRLAGIEDPFGFQWWLGTHIQDVSLEEMQAAAMQTK
jgi:PhnB protein